MVTSQTIETTGSSDETDQESDDQEILRIAQERFKLADEVTQPVRQAAIEDKEFRAGEQWPEGVRQDRISDGRPCLTVNRMPQIVRQITNDQRQNRPSIKVSPVDDKADIETAKILQGLIRHIEYNSNADVAYDTAFSGSVIGGFGFWRVITEYVDPHSFNQELLIKRVRDEQNVYLDPNHKEPDGSDANWGFIFEDVLIEDFKAEHKGSELSKMNDWASLSSKAPSWISAKSARIAEYFYKEFTPIELVQVNMMDETGKESIQTIKESELPEGHDYEIVNRRQSQEVTIHWLKINGIEIMERTTFPGKYIPIIPVYGEELIVNGKLILEGVIRHAKDSQRMYNYWVSTETEAIALAPRAPFIAAEGQITKEYEPMWRMANKKPVAVLTYKPVSLGGVPIGPPQRNSFEPPVGALSNARGLASEDIKATTGIYDAALGAASNEKSGIAIQRRNAQSQTSNFHFMDNMSRSLKHTGKILLCAIPVVYDTGRAMRIIGEDGEQTVIEINKMFTKDGKEVMYDLGAGKYDVTVNTGPSFETRRQEALASMVDLTKAWPQIAAVASDLMVKSMDWPGAQEIAERIKRGMDPKILQDPNKQQELPPEAKAAMDQQMQMIDGLTAKVKEQQQLLDTNIMELQSKERIEFAKMEIDLKKEALKNNAPQAMNSVIQEIAHLNARLEMLGINQPIGEPNPQQQEFNQPGLEQASVEQQNIPTGGLAPGQSMEE